MVLKSIDLFAGIGGIRLGFDRAFDHQVKTVFVSEIDTYAQQTYRQNFTDDFAIRGDITKVNADDVPSFDICLAGFPCQAFSIAGKQQGFEDTYNGIARGILFRDVVRICSRHSPKVIFCENVKGLLSNNKGQTFKAICDAFATIGYTVYYAVLNSKDFGVPQNRERVYIVCFRNDINSSRFYFPKPMTKTVTISDILDDAPIPPRYYLSTAYLQSLIKHKQRHLSRGNGFGYEIKSLEGIAGAIVCGGMGRERNLIVDARPHSMTPETHIKGSINEKNIRKMTPREWARLQGFPDTFTWNLSDTHMYRQFGNSVTVNVIQAIAGKIQEVLDNA